MPDKPFHNPFSALAHLRGSLPEEPPAPPEKSATVDAAATTVRRAVVRIERSGRGGKLVTVVEHLDLNPRALDGWLKSLKTTLGCGGTIEGDAIVLQGDHRGRLPGLLTSQGVKKVTIG